MKPYEDHRDQYESPTERYSHRTTHTSSGLSEVLASLICVLLLIPITALVIKGSLAIVSPNTCEVKRHV